MKKKLLSVLICFVMMLGIAPATVLANELTVPVIVSVDDIEVDQETNMGGAPSAMVGEEYFAQVVATGGDLTYVAGAGEYMKLPKGLEINSETGLISGICTEEPGRYNVYIEVSNTLGKAHAVVGITVGDSSFIPEIITEAGSLGTTYKNSNSVFKVSMNNENNSANGLYNFKWSIKSGNLPNGMMLTYTTFPTVYISGTPEETGIFVFELKAENEFGSDSKTYSIEVTEGSIRPDIQSPGVSLGYGVVGEPYEYQLEATGTNSNEDPMLWSTKSDDFSQESYDLGNGLSMSKTGLVTGVPESNQQVSFYVYAKNSVGTDSESFYITVYDNGTATSISVSPEVTVVEKGAKKEFTVSLDGYGDVEQVAYWSFYMWDDEIGSAFPYPTDSELNVDNSTPAKSVILTVGADEEREQIRVVAYSRPGNGGVKSYATVNITESSVVPKETYSINCVAFNLSDSAIAGTVYIESDQGSYSGSAAFGSATEDTSVTINAVANSGYEFVEWRLSAPESPSATFSKNANYTFTATEVAWLYAVFQKIEVTETYTVSGDVKSFDNGNVTVELIKDGEVLDFVDSDSEYSFSGLAEGTYTLKVSKSKHATREYEVTVSENTTQNVEIWLYGDVTKDGLVNNADTIQINRKNANLTSVFSQVADSDYRFKVANVTAIANVDAIINNADVIQINRKNANLNSVFSALA